MGLTAWLGRRLSFGGPMRMFKSEPPLQFARGIEAILAETECSRNGAPEYRRGRAPNVEGLGGALFFLRGLAVRMRRRVAGAAEG